MLMHFRKWLFNHSREPDAGDIAARLLTDPRSARTGDYLCAWDDMAISLGATDEDLERLQALWDAYDSAENSQLDAFMAETTRQSLERRRTRQTQRRKQILS